MKVYSISTFALAIGLAQVLVAQSVVDFDYSGLTGASEGAKITSSDGSITAELHYFHTGSEPDAAAAITGSRTNRLGSTFGWTEAGLGETKGYSVAFSKPLSFTSIHAGVNSFQWHDYTLTFDGAEMVYNNDSTGTDYSIQQQAPDTFLLDALSGDGAFDGSFSVISGGVSSVTISAQSDGRTWNDVSYLTFVGGTVVPEPSSTLMAMISSMSLIVRRKRV